VEEFELTPQTNHFVHTGIMSSMPLNGFSWRVACVWHFGGSCLTITNLTTISL